MKRTTTQPMMMLIPLLAMACSGESGSSDEANDKSYDEAELERFRDALPSEARVKANLPGGAADPNALTFAGNAELAKLAAGSAIAVNKPAVAMVRLLRAIIKVEPTLYDSAKKEFIWGPWDYEKGVGKVFVYIKEEPKGSDFQYSYAFARLEGNDLATAAPVIWGGATPDPDDQDKGFGVTLWDFEAYNAFDQEHDPDYDESASRDRGRFVSVYGHGTDNGVDVLFNVAALRSFVSKDAAPGTQTADADYVYGRVLGADAVVDFIDWEMTADFCDTSADSCFEKDEVDDVDETFRLRAAFIEQSWGRAEVDVREGDLPAPVTGYECWDTSINRTYLTLSDGNFTYTEGTECLEPFESTLSELGVPALSDIDSELLAALDCVATHGIGDECE